MTHLERRDCDLMPHLRAFLQGRVCVVGVGNRQRGDDGAGPRVIDRCLPAKRGVWLDAGVAPENLLEPIVRTRPDTVLIVDATAFGGVPGECRLMDVAVMGTATLSTHAGSLNLLAGYLSARSGAQVRVLAIQPESIEMREGLSEPVEHAVRQLSALLSEILDSTNDTDVRATGTTCFGVDGSREPGPQPTGYRWP